MRLGAEALLPDVLYMQVMRRFLTGPAVTNVVLNLITLMVPFIGLSDSLYLVALSLELL